MHLPSAGFTSAPVRTHQPPAHDYVTTAQVIPEGVWGDRLGKRNEGLRPSSQWVPGEYVRGDRHQPKPGNAARHLPGLHWPHRPDGSDERSGDVRRGRDLLDADTLYLPSPRQLAPRSAIRSPWLTISSARKLTSNSSTLMIANNVCCNKDAPCQLRIRQDIEQRQIDERQHNRHPRQPQPPEKRIGASAKVLNRNLTISNIEEADGNPLPSEFVAARAPRAVISRRLAHAESPDASRS